MFIKLAFPSIRRSVQRASPTEIGQRTRAAYGKGNRLLLSLGIVMMAPLISAKDGRRSRETVGGRKPPKSQVSGAVNARMPHLRARHFS